MTPETVLVLLLAGQSLPGQGAQGQARPGASQAGTVQPGARDTRPAPTTGTARISGRVTSEDGKPLRKALVRLLGGPSQPEGRVAITDADGRYQLGDLPAGRYTLFASKNGYVSLSYGAPAPERPASPVELPDGGRADEVDFALSKGCVIAGRIFDEFGEPASDVGVTALRQRSVAGRRRAIPMGGTRTTDDLGQYRIFGLIPGEYLVSATARPIFYGEVQPKTEADRAGYAPTYFPGTPAMGDAQHVRCQATQEATADFSLVPVRTARITGRVIDSQGRPGTNMFVTIRAPAAPSPGSLPASSVRADGSFSISSVPPGEYLLIVQGTPSPTSGEREFGQVALTAAGSDMTGVLVQTVKGGRVTGRLVADTGLTFDFPLSRASVGASPLDPESMRFGFTPPRIESDGTFELKGLFGSLLLRAAAPPNWRLKEVRVDGQDRTDQAVDFKGTEDLSGVEIVLTNRMCVLTGTVSDERGAPARDATVIVFADDRARWRYPSRFISTAGVRAQGDDFRLQTLPPGDYLAVAVSSSISPVDYMDPEVLERLRAGATRVTLREGDTQTIALKLTRPEL